MRTNTVYLIHAERPLAHAQHYLGSTTDLESREATHRKGSGSPLLRAMNEQGIGWTVVRTWAGGRVLERTLKNRKNARALCPACEHGRTT